MKMATKAGFTVEDLKEALEGLPNVSIAKMDIVLDNGLRISIDGDTGDEAGRKRKRGEP